MTKRVQLAVLALTLILAAQSVPFALAAPGQIPSGATSLVLTAVPPKLPSDGGSYPAVVVSLIDSKGLPSDAESDTTVYLTSSQTNIAAVPDTVTIPIGKEYVIANASTTTTPGVTAITASSTGLVSASAQLTTITPSGYPSKLKVFVSPSEYLPRSDVGTVRVELVDDAGLPSKAITPVPARLTSSNISIANLDQSSLTIQPGDFYASGTFHTSGSGSAVITAASTGYSSGGTLVTVDKLDFCTQQCGSSELLLKLVPGVLPTDGRTYDALEVSLANSEGKPAVSSSDTVIQLTSDKSEVASVPGLVTISAGTISTLVSITTSALPGTATVTASSAGLLPQTIPVDTVIPAPSKLQAYVAPPSSIFSANGNPPLLVVQLQDSGGNPARARQDTDIVVTSSNASLLSSVVSLKIPKGLDYVSTFLSVNSAGTSVLTAASQGLTSSSANLVIAANPVSVSLSSSQSFIFTNESATMTFTITFLSKPVQDTNVTWFASGGSLSTSSSSTGSSGSASTVFTPFGPGRINITASANSPLTGPLAALLIISVVQTPIKPTPTLPQQILALWYYIVPVVVVVVVLAFYLIRLRRKKQRAEIEAGFEIV